MSDSIEKAPVAWHTKTTDENMAELAIIQLRPER